jgi:hypothetical protein
MGLEVRAAVARRLEAESLQLARDVACGSLAAASSGVAAFHRIIGDDVRARPRIPGGDAGGRGTRRMRARLIGLREYAVSAHR